MLMLSRIPTRAVPFAIHLTQSLLFFTSPPTQDWQRSNVSIFRRENWFHPDTGDDGPDGGAAAAEQGKSQQQHQLRSTVQAHLSPGCGPYAAGKAQICWVECDFLLVSFFLCVGASIYVLHRHVGWSGFLGKRCTSSEVPVGMDVDVGFHSWVH